MNVIKKLQNFKTSGIGVLFVGVFAVYLSTSGEPPAVAATEKPAQATASTAPGPIRLKDEPFYGKRSFESASKPLEAEDPLWYINESNKVACIKADERPVNLCFRELRSDILLTTIEDPKSDAQGDSKLFVKFLNRKTGKITSINYPVKVAADFRGVGIIDQMAAIDFADRVIKSERLTASVQLANGALSTVHFVVPRNEDVVITQ